VAGGQVSLHPEAKKLKLGMTLLSVDGQTVHGFKDGMQAVKAAGRPVRLREKGIGGSGGSLEPPWASSYAPPYRVHHGVLVF
jgi:hypothetical protein